MTLTKIDIVEHVATKCGYSKLEAAELVEKVFETIKDSLGTGKNVKISGFGNFVLRDKKSVSAATRKVAKLWRSPRVA